MHSLMLIRSREAAVSAARWKTESAQPVKCTLNGFSDKFCDVIQRGIIQMLELGNRKSELGHWLEQVEKVEFAI